MINLGPIKMDNKAAIGIAFFAVVGIWYMKKKAGEAIETVGEAINPVNDDNIFHTGVNAVGAKLTGDTNFSLGSWIYDITHDEERF